MKLKVKAQNKNGSQSLRRSWGLSWEMRSKGSGSGARICFEDNESVALQ
jgi:hypothetical protein